jgi:hypothetical protein
MHYLMTQGGLKEKERGSKLVSFGVDGINTFQGLKFGITFQIQCQYVPFIMSVHCTIHWTNLTIQTLSNLSLVSHIEGLLQSLYFLSTIALRIIWNL